MTNTDNKTQHTPMMHEYLSIDFYRFFIKK